MRLERLTHNKIKIFLTFDDLMDRGLTKDDLWKDTFKVQQLFRDMIEEANEELGFEVNGSIAVEVYSLPAQGMVVIVTSEDQEHDFDEEFADDYIEMQVTLDESEDIFYEFQTFEDVIQLAHRLYAIGCVDGTLYSYNQRFYLHVSEEPPVAADDFIAILAEFGSSSTITIHRVAEYGKKIMDHRAIEQLVRYFPA
ncbi:genetic competence negative regulator [Anoxybacillus rupiensis]|jgi:adapter protein MecA 1/2|uniref:Adapter protein MecA n=1 Tax=Anoxybacteroides rupiense TaxID=311460 RepID=A0ABD5IXA5_9BACL|nr:MULTISPECIES: genetic competence negative regulator [Anoxybacillus]KXG11078.1 Adapter protein MecA 2 [Anoxybacillus sp. P3H1B]MBB3906654.1 adapter protein MecA 1/2 [Anoxybacillus rupiensis]MBS2770225.1 genetic competence negative regulator [Anoxybacillus rupiensis]MDE8562399.1 genetic competence negative regulator [Anoxybacillus rupiensis]MED5052026.1 genetic competence negative regulator [Anoxybacillus rupiensis]